MSKDRVFRMLSNATLYYRAYDYGMRLRCKSCEGLLAHHKEQTVCTFVMPAPVREEGEAELQDMLLVARDVKRPSWRQLKPWWVPWFLWSRMEPKGVRFTSDW